MSMGQGGEPQERTRSKPRRRIRMVQGRLGIGLLLLAIALIAGAVTVVHRSRNPRVTQPIAFNHRKHTQDLGLACEFCHQYVRVGAHSGLPGPEICSICHQAPQGTSEEAAKLTGLLKEERPLVFRKLFHLASHVFYTHRRHVEIGKLACENCHGSIATSERPPERPLFPRKPSRRMKFCLDCHRERDQSVDCTSCHR